MAESVGAEFRPVDPLLGPVFTMDSPAWTRLEPQSVSGDPTPGLEARVHDPAWLLARQWQLGEFQGEDVGSPVSVQATWTSTRVDGWRPHGAAGGMHPLGPGDLLEPFVESEPVAEPGLRRRFEAGAQLLTMLADAGFPPPVGDGVLAACALVTTGDPPSGDGVPPYDPAADPHDTTGPRLVALLGDRLPDAERVAAGLERATAASTAPDWLPAAAMPTALAWLDWYRGRPGPDCWTERRLEYAFDVAAGPRVLTAPAFGGGRADWYHFDLASPPGPAPGGLTRSAGPVLAAPLRFPGMAADRYWEFEDGQVNFGALQAGPTDLARLIFAEFALVYGQDWLVVPIDVPVGAVTVIDELAYTDTFGARIVVPRADDPDRFQLFQVEGLPGLLVPPATPGVLEGAALEEVRLLRDEVANLVWAVEHRVRTPGGDPRARSDEPPPAPPPSGTEPGADLDYLLQAAVPDRWVPLVPVSSGPGALELRKGAMVKDGQEVRPLGILLRPGATLAVEDEEVPREGVRIRRVPVLARRPDGGYARWISRRVGVGRGEGASHLAFDAATLRPPGRSDQ